MNRTIKTVKSKPRSPLIAFILAFAFTGLGQIYNGNALKGIAFFGMRTIPLLIIPIYIHLSKSGSYISMFTYSIIFAFIVSIISPIEALYFSLKNKTQKLHKYNIIAVYILFAFINISFIFVNTISIKYVFKIDKIHTSNPSPLLGNENYLLIKKYSPYGYKKGELIIFSDNNNSTGVGRIIGKEGDHVNYMNNRFYINTIQLQHGILNNSEIEALSMDDYTNIITETANEFKYPLRLNLQDQNTQSETFTINVKSNEVLIAEDNRLKKNFYKLIKEKSIIGRIEGIIFSTNPGKLFLLPYLK